MRKVLVLLSLAALAAAACTHLKPAGTAESLRRATDSFFRFQRWGPDLRGAAQLVLPEAQQAWLEKALEAKDDENLKVTEADLDDLTMQAEGTATTVTRVTWHRLPSVTTRTDRVTVEWVEREGIWYAAAIAGGPLPLVAQPPKPAEQPAAGQ